MKINRREEFINLILNIKNGTLILILLMFNIKVVALAGKERYLHPNINSPNIVPDIYIKIQFKDINNLSDCNGAIVDKTLDTHQKVKAGEDNFEYKIVLAAHCLIHYDNTNSRHPLKAIGITLINDSLNTSFNSDTGFQNELWSQYFQILENTSNYYHGLLINKYNQVLGHYAIISSYTKNSTVHDLAKIIIYAHKTTSISDKILCQTDQENDCSLNKYQNTPNFKYSAFVLGYLKNSENKEKTTLINVAMSSNRVLTNDVSSQVSLRDFITKPPLLTIQSVNEFKTINGMLHINHLTPMEEIFKCFNPEACFYPSASQHTENTTKLMTCNGDSGFVPFIKLKNVLDTPELFIPFGVLQTSTKFILNEKKMACGFNPTFAFLYNHHGKIQQDNKVFVTNWGDEP